MTTPRPPKRGGRREGAGRKPVTGVTRSRTVRAAVTPQELESIDAAVAASPEPDRSNWIRDVILAHLIRARTGGQP